MDLITFQQSKWDDGFRMTTDKLYYLCICPTKRRVGGACMFGEGLGRLPLTDFFCLKGVCTRQLIVRICI